MLHSGALGFAQANGIAVLSHPVAFHPRREPVQALRLGEFVGRRLKGTATRFSLNWAGFRGMSQMKACFSLAGLLKLGRQPRRRRNPRPLARKGTRS